MKRGFVFLTVLAIAAMLLAGCAPSGTPSQLSETPPVPGQTTPEPLPIPSQPTPSPIPAPGPLTPPASSGLATGTLTVLVTDAPSYTVTSVVVHFSEVWVHKAAEEEGGEGEWIQLNITGGMLETGSFDLAELRDEGETEELVAAELLAGKYTQLRVVMDEVEGVKVDFEENPSEEPITAKLPSGNLKFVRPFVVEADGSTEIVLDFDLQKSVVFTGASQSDDIKIIVKPVVKLAVTNGGKPAKLEATLESDPDATAELSDAQFHSGEDSVHLQTPAFTGPGAEEASIIIPLPEGTTLGDIELVSWWTYLVEGYIPHIDMVLDYDGDTSRDDVLTAEAAHQNDDDATTWNASYKGGDVGWIETFEGASGVYTSWAMSGSYSDVQSVNSETAVWMIAANDADFGLDTLANFQSATGKTDGSITINEDTSVLALEIEIDNWIYQSEAFVDDILIIIGGVTYQVSL